MASEAGADHLRRPQSARRRLLLRGANEGFNNTSLSSSALFDVGVGYQFNRWLRGDVTLEYRDGGNFQSLYTSTIPASRQQYADFYRGDVSSFIGLVNVYADLGTWYGITPFVGAGIGFAHNTLYGMTDQAFAYPGAPPAPLRRLFQQWLETSFAWALMAGLDFDITQNLKLELGYRYLNYGKMGSGGSNCLNGTARATASRWPIAAVPHNYVSHDQYARLQRLPPRPDLDAPRGGASPPAPLVRKY